jgi:hypothetical protein
MIKLLVAPDSQELIPSGEFIVEGERIIGV